MSRTNEELAVLIQNGATEYIPELWEQIVGLVKWKASMVMTALGLRGSCGNCGVELDDLINTGFPALVEAVNTYKPNSGAFSTWFMLSLKTAFAELTGYRTERQKREPINNFLSLNTPLGYEADAGELADVIEDPESTALMENTNEAIWRNQLHEALETAISDLSDDQAKVIRAKFWHEADRSKIAADMGITSEKVRALEGKAIRTLRKPEYACTLVDFYDFSYYSGTGLTTYQHTGASVQERYVMIQEERRERARKRSAAV